MDAISHLLQQIQTRLFPANMLYERELFLMFISVNECYETLPSMYMHKLEFQLDF